MTTAPLVGAPATSLPVAMSAQTYASLQKHVYQTTGIVLDQSKEYLMEARLMPILREFGLASIDKLCAELPRDPNSRLNLMVIDAMTTNETLFFRDFTTFEALRTTVLPDLLRKAAGRKLQIWSAAASSGQEAYSLAMVLLEMGVLPSQVEILGTDISEQMLAKARLGRYVQFEMNRGLPSAFLKYFVRRGLDWEVRPDLKQMVRFERRDLRDARMAGKFDLLLCRNVLIYFDRETKMQILKNLRASLCDHGLLLLGCAETVLNFSVKLERKVVNQATFYTR